METCNTCTHCVFNTVWGQYECALYKRFIFGPDRVIACKDHIHKMSKKEP